MGRVHFGATIIPDLRHPFLILTGGLDQNGTINDSWFFSIVDHTWKKVDKIFLY